MSRPDWGSYFMGIAQAVAERSDCERSKVGAVVVNQRRIRATGYNGSPSGLPGCEDCPRRVSTAEPGVCSYDDGATKCLAVHAEANALLFCDRDDLIGATLYITRPPCYACEKLIAAVGVTSVVYPKPDAAKAAKVHADSSSELSKAQYCNGCGRPHEGKCGRE